MTATLQQRADWILGMTFIGLGGSKVRDTHHFVEQFASWGLSNWSVVPVGWVEIVLGLLILNRATRRLGAGVIIGWLLVASVVTAHVGQWTALALVVALMTVATAIWLHESRNDGRLRVPLFPQPLAATPPTGVMPIGLFLIGLVGMSFFLRWAIGGTLFWCALPVIAFAQARASQHATLRETIHTLLVYLLVLGVGVSGLWGFVGHFIMSDVVARSIGWATNSGFQKELAFYHLGIGVAGISCLWMRDRFWLALGVVWSVFLYGAASVHIVDFVARNNTASANWGWGMLFGDVLVPTVILGLLIAYHRIGGWNAVAHGVGRV